MKPTVRGIRFFLGVLLLVPGAASGGEIDAHLASTYFLARQAGFEPEEAKRIAIADWSLDLNSTTTAIDTRFLDAPTDTASWSPEVGDPPAWRMRGQTFHSLERSPEEVVKQLGVLRDGIAQRSGDEKLVAIGQYLHALQDAYFHQTADGGPYAPELGHALHPSTDKIALHYDAALHAGEQSLGALRAFAAGETPPVPDAKEIYFRDATGLQLSRDHLRKLEQEDAQTGLVRMTAAIVDSYKTEMVAVDQGVKAADWTVIGDLDYGRMNEKLNGVWSRLHPGDELDPPDEIQWDSPDKINYDTHPELLLVQAPEDPLVTAAKEMADSTAVAASAAASAAVEDVPVGGISFSRAAALGLPIPLDLDAVRIEKGHVVLSGSASGTLDAAELLTTMRLACGRSDPYFSLDPVDGEAWMRDSQAALAEAVRAIDPTSFSTGDAPDEGTLQDAFESDGYRLEGPVLKTFLVRDRDPDLWDRLHAEYPDLDPKLVFHPRWLGETKVGEVLYRADVLLKELSLGVPVLDPSGSVPARIVSGYHDAITDQAARFLLAELHGDEIVAAQPARLWFELPHDQPPATGTAGAGGMVIKEDEANLPAELRDPVTDRARERIESGGALGSSTGSASNGSIAKDGSVMDLSGVWPRVYVRSFDPAAGVDVPGSDPSLDALAARVNSDLPSYAQAYPELRHLVRVLRAYVVSVKTVEADRSICSTLDGLPLMDTERAASALPETNDAVMAMSVAVAKIYVPSEGGWQELTAQGVSVNASGGVALGARDMLAEATDVATSVTSSVAAGSASWSSEPGIYSDGGRSFTTLDLDLAPVARQAREVRTHVVTAADVDAVLAGRALPHAGHRWRIVLGHALASPWVAVFAALAVAAAGWVGLGGLVLLLTRPRRSA
jgi:hypothetical protein